MRKHRQEERLATILLLLEGVRVIKSAHLKRVDVLENVQFFESVFEPHVSVIAGVHGLVQRV